MCTVCSKVKYCTTCGTEHEHDPSCPDYTPLVTSENFGKLLLESAQQAVRYSLIARLMAGLETPDDLTEDEQLWHQEDLLEFLQAELDAAGKSKEVTDG